jgi:hypothetical protein
LERTVVNEKLGLDIVRHVAIIVNAAGIEPCSNVVRVKSRNDAKLPCAKLGRHVPQADKALDNGNQETAPIEADALGGLELVFAHVEQTIENLSIPYIVHVHAIQNRFRRGRRSCFICRLLMLTVC